MPVLGDRRNGRHRQQPIEADSAYNTTAEVFPDMAHDMMLGPDWKLVGERIVRWLNEKGL